MSTPQASSPPTANDHGFRGHHVFRNRLTVTGGLRTVTALHVGSGTSGDPMAPTDMPVARDGRGRLYIPGSSLRGVLRARLESLLRGLGVAVCDPFEKGPQGDVDSATYLATPQLACSYRIAHLRKALSSVPTESESFELAWENACPICRVFGHSFLASRLRVADLPLEELLIPEGAPDTSVRHGVGLHRDLGSAASGILYDFEAVPPGARFGLRLELDNVDDAEAGLVLVGLDLLGQGFATLGGKAARGTGGVELQDLAAHRVTAPSLLAGEEPAALDADALAACRQATREHYLDTPQEGGA